MGGIGKRRLPMALLDRDGTIGKAFCLAAATHQ
jgi:hypothetical protein